MLWFKGQLQADSFLIEFILILLSFISQEDGLIISELDYKVFHSGEGGHGGTAFPILRFF